MIQKVTWTVRLDVGRDLFRITQCFSRCSSPQWETTCVHVSEVVRYLTFYDTFLPVALFIQAMVRL